MDQWLEDNPEWQRDWSDPTTAPGCAEIGEVYDKLKKSHPGWNDVLTTNALKPQDPPSSLFNLCLPKEKEINLLVSV